MQARAAIFAAGLSALLAVAFGLYVLAWPATPVAPVWDSGVLAGIIALLLLAGLFVLDGYPERRPNFDGKFFMILHRNLAILAALALLGHVGGAFLAEPLVWRDLLPTSPAYMLAGLASSLVVLALTVTSLPGMRKRIWPTARRFGQWHYYGSAGMLFLGALHAVGSQFHLRNPVKAAVLTIILVLLVARVSIRRFLTLHAVAASSPRVRQTAALVLPITLGLAGLALFLVPAMLWLIGRGVG